MKPYIYIGAIINNLENYNKKIPKEMKIINAEYDNIILGYPLSEFTHGLPETENYSKNELDRAFKEFKKRTGLEPFLFIGCIND